MSWVKTFHVRTDATAQGLARIKELGGVAVVQDPRAAERREMPLAALAATNADLVLPLNEIGLFLRGCWWRRTRRIPPTRRRSQPPRGVNMK